MTQTLTRYEQYTADYHELDGAVQPEWLREMRAAAWERFLDVGLPTARRGNEPYKYTNVAPIADAELALAMDGEGAVTTDELYEIAPLKSDDTRLVFVDGRFSAEFSDVGGVADGVRVCGLGDAISAGDDLVSAHLGQYADVEEDGFIALNTAFIGDGAFVEIEEGAAVDAPLHLVFVTTDGEQTVSHPRVLVVAGRGSSSTIVESYIGVPGNRCLTNSVAEFVLGEDATMEHYRLLMESEDAFHVGVARVQQGAGSAYNSKVFERQVGLGRFDLYTSLDGENSSCDLKGLYFTSAGSTWTTTSTSTTQSRMRRAVCITRAYWTAGRGRCLVERCMCSRAPSRRTRTRRTRTWCCRPMRKLTASRRCSYGLTM